jgi:1-acyl-sn-glycerol-3-phosphate acyltransferase
VTHPLLKLVTAFEPRDLIQVAPPLGMWPFVRKFLGAAPEPVDEPTLADRDPEFCSRFFEGFLWFAHHYFRHRLYGVEHVPAHGAALIVGNHSGGITFTDWGLALGAINQAHGPERAVYGLGHDLLQWHPVFRKYSRKLGGLRAGHEAALEAFGGGHLVIVYPGSDFDSFRTFADRDRVVFRGRTGFVELALRAQVPIVPVVTAGAQEQYVVLTTGEKLAHLVDLKRRLRSNVAPIGFSVPWGFGPAFLPYVPLPAQITTAFLPPISWPDLGPEAADDPAVVGRCRDEVEAALQARLDSLTLGRVPWLGQV